MPESAYYLLCFLIMLAVETVFVSVARRLHINSMPTSRGMHHRTTPTCGGIIFILAAIYFLFAGRYYTWPMFYNTIMGGTILAAISFTDDLHELSPVLRLLVQTAVVGLSFNMLLTPETLHLFLLTVVFGVGFINAFNFMDGINGMLTGYGEVTIGTLLYIISTLPESPVKVAMLRLAFCLLIALMVFGLFNFRRKALIFAGDVGSITMGFFIVFLIITTVLQTLNVSILVILSVYITDTLFTILQRLFAGENILEPHRKHLYMRLVKVKGWSHLKVSTIYAGTQLAINVGYILIPPVYDWTYVIIIEALLITGYFIGKIRTK